MPATPRLPDGPRAASGIGARVQGVHFALRLACAASTSLATWPGPCHHRGARRRRRRRRADLARGPRPRCKSATSPGLDRRLLPQRHAPIPSAKPPRGGGLANPPKTPKRPRRGPRPMFTLSPQQALELRGEDDVAGKAETPRSSNTPTSSTLRADAERSRATRCASASRRRGHPRAVRPAWARASTATHLLAGVHTRNPSFNKHFVFPCVLIHGRRRVVAELIDIAVRGGDAEKAGVGGALYWAVPRAHACSATKISTCAAPSSTTSPRSGPTTRSSRRRRSRSCGPTRTRTCASASRTTSASRR